jgi:peptidoglycan/LPS O-acetylase OafA/YrhL
MPTDRYDIDVSSGTSRLKHPNYRPDIDGMRAVAVLAVVANHAFPGRLPGGFIGVDVFFVISGFLISTIIFENLDSETFTFREFYSRRIRRIFPALITTLVGVLVLGWFLLISEELTLLGKHVTAGAAFLSNFVLQGEVGYFDSSSETKPLLHLWSLGIEEQFYIAWPLILWFAWKRQINLLSVTLLLAFASFYFNVQGVKTDPTSAFYLPHTRFWELMTGSALAWVTIYLNVPKLGLRLTLDRWLNRIVFHSPRESDGRTLKNFTAIAGTSLLIFGFLAFNKSTTYPGLSALVPILGSLLLIYAGPDAWINQKLLSSKILVWFGLISFPLYLWHWPLISYAWIMEGGVPPTIMRASAVLLAIVLAWATKVFIEQPFRFGKEKIRLKVFILCLTLSIVGLTGLLLNQSQLAKSRGFQDLTIDRKGMEFAFGSSLNWYEGKDNWLFLGNSYDKSVAKLKLAIQPSSEELRITKSLFSEVAQASAKYGTKVVLILGPNKESVYSEYLPDAIKPSETKYISYFLDQFRDIQNLTIHDPTSDLRTLKNSQGLLYWKTDTHWNSKGAFLAFRGFLEKVSIPAPELQFEEGVVHSGDLIGISGLEQYPLDSRDDWKAVWKYQPTWSQGVLQKEKKTSFGAAELVKNSKPKSDSYVWVIGDSFSGAMRDYFNATFRQVLYVGHWGDKLVGIPENLAKAEQKPDMVVVVRVERSF